MDDEECKRKVKPTTDKPKRDKKEPVPPEVKKKISKCKEDKSPILDLSKHDIGDIPSNVKDLH